MTFTASHEISSNLFLALSLPATAQDMPDNSFYRSFMRHFKLSPPRERFTGLVSLHSIRMKTDLKGVIITYESSVTIDSILLKDVDYAFRMADKTGLVSIKYRKKTLILPIIVLQGPSQQIDFRMWEYDEKLNSKVKLLSPFIYLLGNMKPIDN